MPILKEYRSEIGKLTDKDIWETNLPPVNIDEDTREITKHLAGKYRGSVRISAGLFYTDKEFEKERKRLLDIQLP